MLIFDLLLMFNNSKWVFDGDDIKKIIETYIMFIV